MGRLDLFVGGDGGSVAVVISGAVGVCGSFKCGLWSRGLRLWKGHGGFIRGRHGWINVDETQGFFGKDIDAEEIVWPSNFFFFILTFIWPTVCFSY